MTDKLNASGLKELFGRATMIKALSFGHRPGRHAKQRIVRAPNPPGTKFVRRCIRQSGRESTYNRQLYAMMTGHQYEGASS
jgi:hypothetical protein